MQISGKRIHLPLGTDLILVIRGKNLWLEVQWTNTPEEVQFSSVMQLCPTLWSDGLQDTRSPCPSPTPGVYSNSSPLIQWWQPTISSSVIPFSSCLQSFPASVSFQMSQLFASGGQSIGDSASASVLPMNIHDWFPLGWTGLISLQSKGLSRVFSNITVQNSLAFSFLYGPTLTSIRDYWKTISLTRWTFVSKVMLSW